MKTNQFYKNIAYTYKLAENAKRTVVMLEGVPGSPEKKEAVMSDLQSFGLDIFFPRYEGTWQSRGEFLERNPAEPIAEFISALKEGLALDERLYKAKDIILLGSSFGGGVALLLANNKDISKVCAISPVISFSHVRGIETLESYLSQNQADNYRFKSINWKKLIQDELFCPAKETIRNPENVLLIGGFEDDQILVDDLSSYAKKQRIRMLVKQTGHISLSKLGESLLAEIKNFINE